MPRCSQFGELAGCPTIFAHCGVIGIVHRQEDRLREGELPDRIERENLLSFRFESNSERLPPELRCGFASASLLEPLLSPADPGFESSPHTCYGWTSYGVRCRE